MQIQTLYIGNPPALSPRWLDGFMRCFMSIQPNATTIMAMEHGAVAHHLTWALDPNEAAALWNEAMVQRGWLPRD